MFKTFLIIFALSSISLPAFAQKKQMVLVDSVKTLNVKMVDVSQDDPQLGNENAPITVVQYSGFQCRFSFKQRPLLVELKRKYGKKLRIVYKHFPQSVYGKYSEPAARASIAAQKQGKFWRMHDLLYDNFKAIRESRDIDKSLEQMAKLAGLKRSQFKKDYFSLATQNQVEEAVKTSMKIAKGTPNIFINGIQIVGAQEPEIYHLIIKKQLKLSKKKYFKTNPKETYLKLVKHNLRNPPILGTIK